ncbi:allophanate hydrolase [Gluconobacter thailandicus]|uniref:5-oxoprolinase subunit PxpB n=1 Tax=Gluconobacter thailandicus TaxID=257438 RepID=UPI0007770E88|nr:5-oxoprolinase subunit PxpB [Gluconobacter thailandicus]KXV35982.1 allophanate hydrolase [Gluconobacter thailandicus]
MSRISMAGAGALLLDAANGPFSDTTQQKVWTAAHTLAAHPQVIQAVPGVNNLLVTFDPVTTEPDAMERLLSETWARTPAGAFTSRDIEIPVIYDGEDLAFVSQAAGLTEEETIVLHSGGTYSVAAIGAMPGFVYLTGLDPRLALPRRDSPRLKVAQGSVCIGGGHAGIIPFDSPSGWHILGNTTLTMFDPARDEPCFFRLGDTIRFKRVS